MSVSQWQIETHTFLHKVVFWFWFWFITAQKLLMDFHESWMEDDQNRAHYLSVQIWTRHFFIIKISTTTQLCVMFSWTLR